MSMQCAWHWSVSLRCFACGVHGTRGAELAAVLRPRTSFQAQFIIGVRLADSDEHARELAHAVAPGETCRGRNAWCLRLLDLNVLDSEVLGPISAAEVMDYDRKGWLKWPMDGMRAWVGAREGSLAPGAGAACEPASVLTPVASGLPNATWANRCPACRQAALVPGEPKTPFFGREPKPVWMRLRFQAEFVQKAAPAGGGAATYELKRAGAAGAAVDPLRHAARFPQDHVGAQH